MEYIRIRKTHTLRQAQAVAIAQILHSQRMSRDAKLEAIAAIIDPMVETETVKITEERVA